MPKLIIPTGETAISNHLKVKCIFLFYRKKTVKGRSGNAEDMLTIG